MVEGHCGVLPRIISGNFFLLPLYPINTVWWLMQSTVALCACAFAGVKSGRLPALASIASALPLTALQNLTGNFFTCPGWEAAWKQRTGERTTEHTPVLCHSEMDVEGVKSSEKWENRLQQWLGMEMSRPLTASEVELLEEAYGKPHVKQYFENQVKEQASRGDSLDDILEDFVHGWQSSKIWKLTQEYCSFFVLCAVISPSLSFALSLSLSLSLSLAHVLARALFVCLPLARWCHVAARPQWVNLVKDTWFLIDQAQTVPHHCCSVSWNSPCLPVSAGWLSLFLSSCIPPSGSTESTS